jgi:hypothetical protein
MIAAWQADFIGSMIHGPPDRPLWNLITTCCDHKQQAGGPQMTGKIFMIKNFCLLFQDVDAVKINHFRSLWDWIHKATYKNTGTNSSNASSILTSY